MGKRKYLVAYIFMLFAMRVSAHEFSDTTFDELLSRARTLIDSDSWAEAVPLVTRMHEMNPTSLDVAECYHAIGKFFLQAGFYGKSILCHEQALRIRLPLLGPVHPDIASSYNNLGAAYGYKGEYGKASDYFGKALNIQMETLGPDHPDVAKTYNNLGATQTYQGNYIQANEFYERSLQLYLRTTGRLHPETARCYYNMGCSSESAGDFDKAAEYYAQSLEIRLQTLNPDHPDIAQCYYSIGSVRDSQGKYDEAIELYKRALAIQEKKLDANHPDIARNYNNIGVAYENKGDNNQAIAYHSKALTIRIATLGPEHRDVADSYNNLGLCYNNKGNGDKAIEQYQLALAILIKALGPYHPEVATCYNNLGVIYSDKGDFDRAIGFFEQSLTIRAKATNRDTPEIATNYNNLGLCYNGKGDQDRGEEYYLKALAIWEQTLGANHPLVATSFSNLGTIYQKKGDLDRATSCYNKSLAIRLQALGPDHTDVASCYTNLGNIRAIKKDYDAALEYYGKSLCIQTSALGPGHPDVATNFNNVGAMYKNKGNIGEAIGNYSQALAIWEHSSNYLDIVRMSWNMAKSLREKAPSFSLEAVSVGIGAVERARLDLASAKTGIMAKALPLYYAGVDLSARDGNTEKAFEYSESLRSRGFLDQMGTEAALRLDGITDGERTRLHELVTVIDGTRRELERLNGLSAEKRDVTAIGRSGEALSRAERELTDLDATIGKRIPKYAQLRNPQPVDIAAARRWCGEDRVVLEYVLWDDSLEKTDGASLGAGETAKLSSWCLIVGRQGVEAIPLDADYDYASAIDKLRSAVLWKSKDAKYEGLRNGLYEKLIAPVAGKIPGGTKRVVIVPDGPLAFLPMDILRKDSESPDFGEDYAVSVSPSISVSILSERARELQADAVLAIGGAIYGPADERTGRGSTTRGYTSAGHAERSGNDSGGEASAPDGARLTRELSAARTEGAGAYYAKRGFKWQNLPGTLAEVRSLRDTVFAKESTTVLEGIDASESKLKALSSEGILDDYDIVHIACHGYFDDMISEMSSVVLSEASGITGPGVEDGYLTVSELALLDLDAAMVNLSACETGLSRVRRGDGMVGLTRSLLVAGADSVGVSLWSVDDSATEAFMTSLYSKVRSGMEYPEAYAAVKREFRNDDRWSHPCYWAAFTLYE